MRFTLGVIYDLLIKKYPPMTEWELQMEEMRNKIREDFYWLDNWDEDDTWSTNDESGMYFSLGGGVLVIYMLRSKCGTIPPIIF